MNLEMNSFAATEPNDEHIRKLDSYIKQAGIKDKVKARQLLAKHFLAHDAAAYPYALFRNGTLYLFTAAGISAAEALPSTSGTDYLRFDGERITRLDPLYYLGPSGEKSSGAAAGFWDSGFSSNNNNNNNNNNNGNNGNNG